MRLWKGAFEIAIRSVICATKPIRDVLSRDLYVLLVMIRVLVMIVEEERCHMNRSYTGGKKFVPR